MSEQIRREECRREVRRYLAERQALAFRPESIVRKLNLDGNDFALAEVQAALGYLVSLSPAQATETPDPDGATNYYQATSAGVLAHERRR